ncbi:MAG: beta-L-arabinofuranosidase domain-containing protein [Fimbriimonadaceae bacterium]
MIALIALAAMTQQEFKKLEPVPFTNVQIRDRFWQPRQETNRRATVEHSLAMLEKYGNFLVFNLANEGKREGYKGLLFTDSDMYKTMEGIAYTLATHPDPALDRKMDEVIALIADVQEDDGYVNTWFQVTRPQDKFKNLRDWHELYCGGHMIEAAVAHHQATGKDNFLNVALKFAGLVDKKYGPEGEMGYCGHPEVELALIKLWKETKNQRWFALSRKMVETRGQHFFAQEHNTAPDRYDGTYWLDDMPIAEHSDIKGHAVRAAYLMSGAADIARETEDAAIVKMLDRVWRSATERRVYVTGGIGPSNHNEGFTVDYDLPNLTAYQETCASIAMALWGHRMALLYGDAKYMDAVETALYNGVISGVALDGRSFFYVNPLASMGNHARSEWFQCACCPPNVLRTIASLGGYAYATTGDALYVNLFVGGSMTANVGRQKVGLDVATDYPWDGKVTYTFQSPANVEVRLRIPGWCEGASVSVNGRSTELSLDKGYFVVNRDWKAGDKLVLDLPMPVIQIEAHPSVEDDRGLAVVQRGPLVYCAEQVDNQAQVDEVVIPRGAAMTSTYEPGTLGGVVTVTAQGQALTNTAWDSGLYRRVQHASPATVKLVPYGFWANRGRNKMATWMPTSQPPPRILTAAARAKVSMSYVSGNAQPWGINDGVEPKSSGEQPRALAHFWPHKGGEEWIQYTWTQPMAFTGVEVYWFDDTGRGECRIPESWRLQALVAGAWQDVPLPSAPIEKDKWCSVKFAETTTTALRIVVRQRDGWASGIHEWKVTVADD